MLKHGLLHPEILAALGGAGHGALAIATGERRIYANILLTIGVVPPSAEDGA